MVRKEIVAYNTDASRMIGKVEKVVFPKNVKEVSEIVRITNLDIVPRGAGSGFEGGCVPNSSLVVDMTKMNKILSFNPSKRIIVVEAGIILKELNEKLRSKGYEFPIDPLNKGISSIGGMIATNASGKRSMKYGSIRDWIDEIEFVNGKGEIIKTSKADLMDVCGMEGITGIVTSVKIRVLPKIKRSFSVFQSDNLEDVLHVGRRLKSENEVCSIILLSKQVSKMMDFPEKYYLIVEFDSERGKIKGEEYETLLKKIENLYYTLGINDYYTSEDPKLFFDKIKEFLEMLEMENVIYFSYLGSGIIHPFFKDSEEIKHGKIIGYIKRIQAKLGKYGYGLKRKDFLESFDVKLIQRVKQRHDPSAKLNRGKLIDFSAVYNKKPESKERVRADDKIKDSFIDNSDFVTSSPEFSNKTISKLGDQIKQIVYKEERLEIKPNIGERLSANILSSDVENKSPEEKINELIKEAEIIESSADYIEDNFPGIDNRNSFSDNKIIEKGMAMNGQTRLNLIEKKEVEAYSKEIPREIAKESSLPLKSRLNVDYGTIKHNVEAKPEVVKKPETSQEERDLINKIMGNRFGNINKGEGQKSEVPDDEKK